jgi:hypothetical protein
MGFRLGHKRVDLPVIQIASEIEADGATAKGHGGKKRERENRSTG